MSSVPLRMLSYAVVRGGLGLLAVKRACALSRLAHTSRQSEYRPIKKVMVANRGEPPSVQVLTVLIHRALQMGPLD